MELVILPEDLKERTWNYKVNDNLDKYKSEIMTKMLDMITKPFKIIKIDKCTDKTQIDVYFQTSENDRIFSVVTIYFPTSFDPFFSIDVASKGSRNSIVGLKFVQDYEDCYHVPESFLWFENEGAAHYASNYKVMTSSKSDWFEKRMLTLYKRFQDRMPWLIDYERIDCVKVRIEN